MTRILHHLLALTMVLPHAAAATAAADSLPDGLMLVGYDGDGWFPYVSRQDTDTWQRLAAIRDPAYLTRQADSDRFYVKGNDGKLYRYQPGADSPERLPAFDDVKFTQLRAFPGGFVMVELIDGKSSATRILSIDDNLTSEPVLRQTSSQFHPLRHDHHLYYAHVSCRLECKPPIQEVWDKNLTTGRARQLTLLNATSYLFSVDPEGRYGFISSNARGYYHLARLDLSTGTVTWLTDGRVTDSYPAIAVDGSLYFIRRTPDGSKLMRLANAVPGHASAPEATPEPVLLPEGVTKIRYLELSR